MGPSLRFSQLSRPRQALIRLCQTINHGSIEGLEVKDADPVFDQASVVVIDAKLDKVEVPRPELGLADFELCAEVSRLMFRLDELKNGTIQRLEVCAGVPRRLVFETRLLEAPGAQTGVR
jgi:hypothetical protein